MRRGTAVLAAAAALLVLAGCANIPTGGGVTKLVITGTGGGAPLLTLPGEPGKGASQEEILAGFIRAGRSSQSNYQVARDFLTSDFRSQWNPNAGVLISSSSTVSTSLGDDTRQIVVSATAEVDGDGEYMTFSSAQSKPLVFTFKKEKGEWRISAAPDGTVLPPNRFASIFHDYDLMFFDPSLQYLVPDRRWFADGTGVASRIVRGVLGGPSALLKGGVVVTAFPSGTQLTTAPVIDAGQATVDLTSQVSSESAAAKRRMTQQLTASLSTLAANASITVGGFPVAVSDGPEPDHLESVSPDPIGFEKGAFGTLIGGTVRPLAGINAGIDKLSPIGAAVSRDGNQVATLSSAGISVVRGSSAPVLLDARRGLTAPSSDPEGYVWSTPTDHPGSLIAYDTADKPHAVAASIDGQVVSMSLSRDGTRLLMALSTSTGPRLMVAGIVRDKDLVPVSLGEAVLLPIGADGLLSASWVDSGTVVALTADGDSSAVMLYALGGQSQTLGTVDGGTQVVGGNGTQGIRVLAAGSVFALSGGFGWQDTGLNASFLASQQ